MKLIRAKYLIAILALALAAIAVASIYIGPVANPDPNILWKVRFPRVVLGILVGMGLASSGAIMQGILRNPLADPYILGTSGGAAIGTIIAYHIRDMMPGWVMLSTVAFYALIFLGSFAATCASYLIARSENQVSIVNLLLSGVIVSTLCGAVIFLYFTLLSDNSFSIFFFWMGSLTEGNWNLIGISAAIIILGIGVSLVFANNLNILSLGEQKAHHLGVSVEKMKFFLFALTSLIVSASVAISGCIGFVGLIVPHITRLIVGPNHKSLIPCSALLGGILLVCADDAARTIAQPVEIPVGVIMSLVGAPFFLWLLKRKRKARYF